ncbi:DUF3761 domain-containing protein [Massilia sp. YIM B02763]|uniref:DUF3761 domain-containing protein n=1 Tax=Massilia sp. YIM B02763 TaxID=3050130 RepID=UPI0035A5A892
MQRIAGQPNEAELTSHQHYKAKDGREVHSPAKSTQDKMPAGASGKCRGGRYSASQHRKGTCSQHGGVISWLCAGSTGKRTTKWKPHGSCNLQRDMLWEVCYTSTLIITSKL